MMTITSLPTATTQYRLDLPEVSRDYFIPEQKMLTQEYIATSTAPAGYFRQLVKYDITSVSRQYRILLDLTRAATLQSMVQSDQTEFYAYTQAGVYRVSMTADLEPRGPTQSVSSINLSFIERVS